MLKKTIFKRILIAMLIGLGFGVALSEVAFYFLGETARKPKQITIVIPAGTAELIAHGQQPPALPENMDFVTGDTLVIDNQDSVNHQLGPLWIPAGTKGQLALGEEENLMVECSFQSSQFMGMEVHDPLTPGVRITGILNAGLPLGVLLSIYALVPPVKKEEKKEHDLSKDAQS
ncbi:MAG: hypothetical protein IT310_09290 [Anaerolineales bacterium]|nr:hypothetical protein [Anaerolineales bacterium]